MIQVNLPLMFYINEILHNLFTIVQQKALCFFYRDIKAFHEVPLTPPCFPSHSITKNAEIHHHPMRDVIIEQPLRYLSRCTVQLFIIFQSIFLFQCVLPSFSRIKFAISHDKFCFFLL